MLAWSSLVSWRHETKPYCHLLCKVGGASEKVFSCVSNKRAWLCSCDIQIQELPLPKYGTVTDMKLKEVLRRVKLSESLLHMWVSSCAVQASMGRGGTSLINKTQSSVLHCWEERKVHLSWGLYSIKRTWFALEDKLGRHLAKSSTAHFSHTLVFEVNFRENILLFSHFSSLFKIRQRYISLGCKHTLKHTPTQGPDESM